MSANDGSPPHAGAPSPSPDSASGLRESAAFPRLLRYLALSLMGSLAGMAVWTSPRLRLTEWSASSLTLLMLAWVCIAWFGYWLLHSRTRLADDDELVQTWLWTKRARAADVARMKLVHVPFLDALIAPRLLVYLRSGGVMWFHAADVQVLSAFMARVVQRRYMGND